MVSVVERLAAKQFLPTDGVGTNKDALTAVVGRGSTLQLTRFLSGQPLHPHVAPVDLGLRQRSLCIVIVYIDRGLLKASSAQSDVAALRYVLPTTLLPSSPCARTHHSTDYNMLTRNKRFQYVAEAIYLIQKVSQIDRRKS